jgi:aquaporin Z
MSPRSPIIPLPTSAIWRPIVAEFIATAALLAGGLSIVIVIFGEGSPVARIVPSEDVRRPISGFLFGSLGALIAVSPLGKESGAHVNPVVTMAFWLVRRLETRMALGYVGAQLAGALAGSLPMVLWGAMGRSVAFGATAPGAAYTTGTALLGEVVTTFGLVASLCIFLAFRRIRPYTPAMIPFLYAVMVYVEAPISGTSTNPARSLGPAIVAGVWQDWWIYWVGPVLGALAALAVFRRLAIRIQVAKLYHFDVDPSGVFRRGRS